MNKVAAIDSLIENNNNNIKNSNNNNNVGPNGNNYNTSGFESAGTGVSGSILKKKKTFTAEEEKLNVSYS